MWITGKTHKRAMNENARRTKVVIVGGGFAGIEAARALSRAPVDVVLIDRENHHTFQPLLYQVATAALSPADIAWPIRSMLRSLRNVRVLMAEVTAIDAAKKRVTASGLDMGYNYLVLATGVTHSYFGHDEWSKAAPGLKRLEDARDIRRRFLIAFERAELLRDPEERRRQLTFVIVGGGPTGVEMAGAMAEVSRQTLKRDFRDIDPASARIMLIEAGPRLLPAFPETLSRYAQASLEKMDVEVRLGAPVTQCDGRGVTLGGDRIEAATIIWAAGVAASALGNAIGGAERDRMGRIRTRPDLSLPAHPEIFIAGDLAAVDRADGSPVPGIAPAAKQMGRYIGKVIAARVSGGAPPAPFAYSHAGDLATIGRKSAVVKIGPLQLTGFIGWLFWSVAHIYFLIGVRNRIMVAINWLWNYVTFQRGARLISVPPQDANSASARN
jgi:NADH dehydrogenase